MTNTTLDVRRHMELFNPYTFDKPVHVIGAGATGSWLVLMLAKLGITNIKVYDFDVVEEHNVPNQLFGIQHIGMPKVEALKQIVLETTGTEITVFNTTFVDQRVAGIVFLMVDSMEGRRQIWNNAIKLKTAVELLVEPRMGLDVGRIYNVNPVNPTQIKAYEDCWYPDSEAEVSACGTSLTVITSAMSTASWCARQLINFANDVELSNEILIDYKFNQIYPTTWK